MIVLTFTTIWANSTDDKLKFLSYISQKTCFDISADGIFKYLYYFPPGNRLWHFTQIASLKYQNLFSEKKKKKKKVACLVLLTH